MLIFCSVCHRRIMQSAPKVIVKGEYVCQECAYHMDKRNDAA